MSVKAFYFSEQFLEIIELSKQIAAEDNERRKKNQNVNHWKNFTGEDSLGRKYTETEKKMHDELSKLEKSTIEDLLTIMYIGRGDDMGDDGTLVSENFADAREYYNRNVGPTKEVKVRQIFGKARVLHEYLTVGLEYVKNWQIGFGLQAIDGLKPPNYLLELAEKQVSGEMSYDEIEARLRLYYLKIAITDNMEADITSVRIAKILSSKKFKFSIEELKECHRKIFSNIETFIYPAGEFRTEYITKDECILNGNSVVYADPKKIYAELEHDFNQEASKSKSYCTKSREDVAHGIMSFVSDIWQIHPFREGNTRTSTVFAIKYLRSFGFALNNEPFKENSKYFRDSLALANAEWMNRTDKYLRMFTENTLLGGTHELVISKDID